MENIKKTIIIIVGNFLLALGIVGFVLPVGLITGGGAGIGLIVEHFIPIPISTTVFCINVIMFIVGYFVFGKKFALGTALSTVIFPTFLAILESVDIFQNITDDLLLSGIYGGMLIGIGMGLVLRVGASTGGMDIPPLVVNKKTGISVALCINVLDVSILLGQAMFSTIEQVLYGILVVIITTLVIDRILMVGKTEVQVTIISPKYEEIRQVVFEKLNRGCTYLSITTGYHLNEQQAVMVVVSKRELHYLQEYALSVDSHAFIISNSTHSVKGRGFTLPSIDE